MSTNDESKTRTTTGVEEHWCMHEGCKKWGSFGISGRYGQLWFCGEHKSEGDKEAK